MKSILAALAIVTILAIGPTVTATRAQSSFEAEPVLSAKDLVPAELLKGPRFTVDDRVPVKGFIARFAIKSDFGPFEARGIRMLHVRVREIHALGQLDEMSKTKEFAGAAGRAVARPVTATAHMIVHPVDTVTGIPDGVGQRVALGSDVSPGPEGIRTAGLEGGREFHGRGRALARAIHECVSRVRPAPSP